MNAGALVVSLASLMIGAALALTTPVAVAQQIGGTGLATPDGATVSVWSGVYTATQNKRGEEVYSGRCATCHGLRLNGDAQPDMPPSPAIARASFLRKWAGRTVAALFDYVRTTMPPEYPGTLTDQDSIDAIAHMFAVSTIPAGDKELPPDKKALEGIVIEGQPK